MQGSQVTILSFFSFINISNPEILLPKLLLRGKQKLVKGTILIAHEGFNGSISGTDGATHWLLNELMQLTEASDVNAKSNYSHQHPFQKFRVKLKPEIVAMQIPIEDVNVMKGRYIKPEHWDKFISSDDVVTIDTRNDYEVAIGKFKGAIDPKTSTFKQFPEWVHNNKDLLTNKKIAMYCTGGIRCEKSTSYLKMLGYSEVYHLQGGILQYLENTKNKNQMWQGECFVFDDRVAVTTDLSPAPGYWFKRN